MAELPGRATRRAGVIALNDRFRSAFNDRRMRRARRGADAGNHFTSIIDNFHLECR